jgi:virginiamycin B lyase
VRLEPLDGGPYALARTGDVVWTTLVRAGALHRSDSGEVISFGPDARPMLVVADGAHVHVSRGDDTISSVGLDGSVQHTRLPEGTKPYGLAVVEGGLRFSGLGDVVGEIRDGEARLTELPAGTMPGPLWETWGTCFGADAQLHWPVGAAPELLPLGPGHGPVGIAGDAHGLRWAEITSGTFGIRDPDGTIRRVDLPGDHPRPHAALPDGDGGTFVTCWGTDALVHVDPDGTCVVHEFPTGSEPHGLCRDADGSVLVALEAGFVARVRTGRG